MSVDRTVQLNYVIPVVLEDLLARYCKQNLVSPSALIRQLILEYVEGSRCATPGDHPTGRRTTAALSARLLSAFSKHIESNGGSTKAAVIAALLNDFLPNRVFSGDTVNVAVDIPVEVFNTLFERYGPGPAEAVVSTALTEHMRAQSLVKEASNA